MIPSADDNFLQLLFLQEIENLFGLAQAVGLEEELGEDPIRGGLRLRKPFLQALIEAADIPSHQLIRIHGFGAEEDRLLQVMLRTEIEHERGVDTTL